MVGSRLVGSGVGLAVSARRMYKLSNFQLKGFVNLATQFPQLHLPLMINLPVVGLLGLLVVADLSLVLDVGVVLLVLVHVVVHDLGAAVGQKDLVLSCNGEGREACY